MLGEARGGCDAQDASQFSGTARRVLCFVEDGERRFHAPEVLGACFGQRQGARATCEEHRAELPLQSRDDARGRRLGKSEVAGSTMPPKRFCNEVPRSESGCERASRTVRQTYLSWYEEHKT